MKTKFLIVFINLFAVVSFAQVTWDGGAGTNNWSDNNNWDCDCAPSSSDHIIINSGNTVDVDVSTTVQSILNYSPLTVLSGVTLTVDGATAIGIQNGTMVVDGTLNVLNTTTHALQNVNLSNNGTVTIGPGIGSDGAYGCYFTNDGNMTFDGINSYAFNMAIGSTSPYYLDNNIGGNMYFYNCGNGIYMDRGTQRMLNYGYMEFDNLSIAIAESSFTGDPETVNESSGYILFGTVTNKGIHTGTGEVFLNKGTIETTPGTNQTFGAGGTQINDTLGILIGDGNLSGYSLKQYGTISPGDGSNLGVLNFVPYVTTVLDSISKITLDILDTSGPGTGHDKITAGGASHLTLNGTLDVIADPSYTPTSGDCFELISIASPRILLGGFDTINLPTITPLNWTYTQNSRTIEICIENVYFADTDGDGFGDPNNSMPGGTTPPSGYVTDSTDCDDSDPNEYPGQTWYYDQDGDGQGNCSAIQCLRPTNGFLASELSGNACVASDVTKVLDSSGNVSITATEIENNNNTPCTYTNLTVSPMAFTCVNVGVNTVTLTATDDNGLIVNCTANVTIQDNDTPTVNCQDITLNLDAAGSASTTAAAIDAGSSDACGIASTSLDITTFTCNEMGSNAVILTVTDNNNNSDTCGANVEVEDNAAPTATCQDITVSPGAGGTVTILPSDVDGGSSDNCYTNLALDNDTFGCGDAGANTVTLTVTDNSTNFDDCTATVTVQLVSTLTAVCKNISVDLDASGIANIMAIDVDDGSSAPCGNTITFSINQTAFDCTHLGINTLTLTVTDNNSNTDNCLADVTIQDVTAPTATCQDITIQLNNAGNETIAAADINNGSIDECTTLTLSADLTSFDCTMLGTNSVILTATDGSNNSSTCSSQVTVEDDTDPVAVCQDLTLSLDAAGMLTLTPAQVDNGSTDACGINTSSLDMTTFDCTHIGNNTVNLTVTDNSSNSNSCSADITIEDTTAPTALCMDITVNLDASGNASIVPADVDNNSMDACGIASYSATPNTFTCNETGANAVVLTVTDNSTNQGTCNATVTVADIVAPTAVCQDITVGLDANGSYNLTASQIDGGSSDDCGIANSNATPSAFSCSNVGTQSVTLTVSDLYGNSDTCLSNVSVEDNNLPIAVCKDLTISLDGMGMASIMPANVDNGSSLACGTPNLSLDLSSFDCSHVGVQVVNLTATDPVTSNSSSCSSNVTVNDNSATCVFPVNCSETEILKSLPANYEFGKAVAISGNRVVISSSNTTNGYQAGGVYVFEWDGSSWNETLLVASNGAENQNFGCSIDIEGDNIIVGTFGGAGAGVYLFEWDGNVWNETILTPSTGFLSTFGRDVAINNNRIIVGDNSVDRALIFEWDGSNWNETILIPSDQANDDFGWSVAIENDRAIVGSPNDDDNGTNSGSVYVFDWDGTNWNETKLVASDGESYDRFGRAVAITIDRLLIGAEGDNGQANESGTAYVYDWDSTNWIETKIMASDGSSWDYFGSAVAIQGDEVLIGAQGATGNSNGSGVAYHYEYDGTSWLENKITSSAGFDYDFGASVDLDNGELIIGAPNAFDNSWNPLGTAYHFEFSNSMWDETELQASDLVTFDRFGYSVDVDNNRVIVGAYNGEWDGSSFSRGAAYIYEWNGSFWEETKLIASDSLSSRYGNAVAIDGDRAIVGSPYKGGNNGNGSVYIYDYDGTNWIESKVVANDGILYESDNFGWSVALDGDVAIVGAPKDDANGNEAGAAYVLNFNGTNWTQTKLNALDGDSNDEFGYDVDIDNNKIIVGAYHDEDSAYNAGSAYLFEWNGSSWVSNKILPADLAYGDLFGEAVAIDGDRFVIGCSEDDDNYTNSGSVYIYDWDGSNWIESKLYQSNSAAHRKFGQDVQISGDRIITSRSYNGSNDSEQAFVFDWDGTTWVETVLEPSVTAGTESYGVSVAIDGDTKVVGSESFAGRAFIYKCYDYDIPIAICKDFTVSLDGSGMGSIVAADIDNGSYDNTGITNMTVDFSSFTCSDLYFKYVTLTVSDVDGNTDNCVSSVTVEDPTGFCCPVAYSIANGNPLTGMQSIDADFETQTKIDSDQIINSGATVDYDATTEINLLAGFETILGVKFNAFIDGCGNLFKPEDKEKEDLKE